MSGLEQILVLFLAAVFLAAAARRFEVPYPIFLAVGGIVLAFLPGTSTFTVPPELALAIFVAPVLLDSAFDTSLRDLQENWVAIFSLVVFAVSLTTAAVAIVAHTLQPDMPWAAAIALGAVVAPPDAVAAVAVLRQVNPPHRILTVLEGESLLNDASALLIFRLAVDAATNRGFSLGEVILPTLFITVVGSLVAGYTLAWLLILLTNRIQHVPTSIILQFISTFGVWILAEHVGLSGVFTVVCFAITLAQTVPATTPARSRIPSYAVWETVVFGLNILAFIFIGLQLRPILERIEEKNLWPYFSVAVAVLLTVIVVRMAWHMSFNAGLRLWYHRFGFNPPRPMLRPSASSGLVISWSGMRGIVTLAAALALPEDFPYRDLIVLTAFSVVLGTLVIQGLTLKFLLRILNLNDGDPVGQEVNTARERALAAGLATLDDNHTPAAELVRVDIKDRLSREAGEAPDGLETPFSDRTILYQNALRAARQAVLAMRSSREIGDDAFHLIEEELDWLDMAER